MRISGFEDVSTLLRSGVYILCRRGVVIYVGKSKSLYERIYTHKHFANRAAKGRPIPSWLPVKGIAFDEVHIRYCHVDSLDALEAETIALYKPHYNTNLKSAQARIPSHFQIGGVQLSVPPRPQIERRL